MRSLLVSVLLLAACHQAPLTIADDLGKPDDLALPPDLATPLPPACTAAPAFVALAPPSMQFYPEHAVPCSTQELDLLGDNFDCRDVRVDIDGKAATIVSLTPTFSSAAKGKPGITIRLPSLAPVTSPDGGLFSPVTVRVVNPFGFVDSDEQLLLSATSRCP